jgi:DivIVA domain-containing protein
VSTFPRAPKSKPGYNVDEVEDFLRTARLAYETDRGRAPTITASDIRQTAFALQKGGYVTDQVDAALERLEDAFALREREAARARQGDAAWYAEARSTAQVILNRLARESGHKFNRTSILTVGYRRADVDAFSERLVHYFRDGQAISLDDVRTVTFRSQRGGYREAQVDSLLDSVTDVMLAVR